MSLQSLSLHIDSQTFLLFVSDIKNTAAYDTISLTYQYVMNIFLQSPLHAELQLN